MEKLNGGIYRICIPFEYIYTTAFILVQGKNAIILDSGFTENDANTYIIPKITELGVVPKYLVVSHSHGDHAGGMNTLRKVYPDAKPITNLQANEVLLECFKIIPLPGHSDDSIAVLDITTKTLLTGDCLQMYGIGHWGGNFTNYRKYLNSIKQVRNMELETIIAAHDFVPNGYIAKGETEIQRMLNTCEKAVLELVKYVKENEKLNDVEVALKFREDFPELPRIPRETVINIRKELENESNFSE